MKTKKEVPCKCGDFGMDHIRVYANYMAKCVMPTPAHTPTPWEVGFERVIQAQSESDPTMSVQIIAKVNDGQGLIRANANAAFIVRAVNSHSELVAAVKLALAESVGQPSRQISPAGLDVLREAIAKAEGK